MDQRARRLSTLILTSAACLLVGCQGGPLGRSERDFDRRVSLASLRTVTPLDLDDRGAQPPTPITDPAGLAAVRTNFQSAQQIELTLEEARAAALEHNLDLKVSLIAPTIDAERINEEEGRYEALIFANAQFADRDDATALATESNQSKFAYVQPGIRIPLRTGGTAEIRAPMSRSKTDNRFALLNPSYTSDLEFSLSHNLLRGAGRRANSYAIRVADIGRQQSEARAKLQIISQLAAADRAYWTLYATRQALDVRARQYELAERQLGRAQRRFDAGAVAEVEVARAKSGLADRVRDIIVAQNSVLLAERELKRLLNIPDLGVDSPQHVVTVTDPEPLYYTLDGDKLAGQALDGRMELLDLELQLAADEALEALRRNDALPLLAAQFTYRINGLGAEFTEAIRVASENNFEDWELGLTAEVPIGNEQRKAAIEQAVLARLQRLATRASRRQQVRKEVLDAVDNIDSGWQQILAARQAVALNERTLQSEESLFDNGRSTSTDVLNADARLADARLQDIQAVVNYQISQIDLAVATGTLLGASKVEWEPYDPRQELTGGEPAVPTLISEKGGMAPTPPPADQKPTDMPPAPSEAGTGR
ncbi:MAG: TolC family protein [Phycisphaeraceae bacterium]|nr:MAG: TolC family protein [Phycisphaeraceae bacterium]